MKLLNDYEFKEGDCYLVDGENLNDVEEVCIHKISPNGQFVLLKINGFNENNKYAWHDAGNVAILDVLPSMGERAEEAKAEALGLMEMMGMDKDKKMKPLYEAIKNSIPL